MIQELQIGELTIADDNIRSEVGDISDLVKSVKTVGVLEPLLVRDDGKLVVCGSRRLAAASAAGLETVPCIVRPFTEQERVEAMLVENLQREDLSPTEEAHAFKRLLDLGVSNQKQLALRLGVSPSHVSKRLSLLELPEDIQGAVDEGKIKLDVAHQLTRIADDEELVTELTDKLRHGGGLGNNPEFVNQAVTHDVDREIARRLRENKVKQLRKKLEADGEPVVDVQMDSQGWAVSLPEGHAFVATDTYREDVVDLDPKKHAKLKCHGVAITTRGDVETVEVCTDTSNHPNKAEEQKTARAKEAEKAKKRTAAWQKVTDRRHEWLMELVDGRRIANTAVIELVWISFAQSDYYGSSMMTESELAAQLLKLPETKTVSRQEAEKLGLDLGDDESEQIELELDVDEELDNFAKASAANKLRAVVALAVARLEPAVRAQHGDWDNTDVAYFDLLEKLGYELGKEELNRRTAAKRAYTR